MSSNRAACALAVATLAACGADPSITPDAGSPGNGAPADAGRTVADAGQAANDDAGTTPPADAGVVPDAGMAMLCPPTGPFGTREGSIVPDIALNDCDGNPVSTHELCGFDAAYFFVYADW